MQCQANNDDGITDDDIDANIALMEKICGENGIVEGCQLLHSAYTMKSMTLIRAEKIKEALSLLENTYASQLKKLRNCETHPFLEQCISQMALL